MFASNAYLDDFPSQVLVTLSASSISLSTHSSDSILTMAFSGFQLGIKVEIFLIPHEHPANGMPDLEKFAKILTEHYNKMTTGVIIQ